MDGKTEKTLMCVDLVELDGRVLKKWEYSILSLIKSPLVPKNHTSFTLWKMDPIPNQLHGQFGSNPEQVYKKKINIYGTLRPSTVY